MRVPAQIADGPATAMMIDTGMGVTLLTPEACERAHCVREGTWSGQRMSGQTVALSMARVSSLTVAGHRVENARVAVFESDEIIHRDLGVEGIAGLDVFRDQPVTFDHHAMRLVLESAESLAARRSAGTNVNVRVKHEGPSTEVYLPLEIGPGSIAEMEVDSGSLHMILDDRFMATLGIDPDSSATTRKDGRDETGQPYVRRYAKLPHAVHVPGSTDLGVPKDAQVMFQKIIHDGLLGARAFFGDGVRLRIRFVDDFVRARERHCLQSRVSAIRVHRVQFRLPERSRQRPHSRRRQRRAHACAIT